MNETGRSKWDVWMWLPMGTDFGAKCAAFADTLPKNELLERTLSCNVGKSGFIRIFIEPSSPISFVGRIYRIAAWL